MMYLSGATNKAIEQELIRLGVGLMLNPKSGHARPEVAMRYPAWAADNGCFSQGESFDADVWLAWLEPFSDCADTCLFAVAPDVVGDAAATLERSAPYMLILRGMGFPVAFVAQDGQESLPVPWDDFDCLFVGGSTDWKLSEAAYRLIIEANRRGKWTHQGRVNSWRRFRASWLSGFDSADGTYLAFGPNTLIPRLTFWIEQQQRQPRLFEMTG